MKPFGNDFIGCITCVSGIPLPTGTNRKLLRFNVLPNMGGAQHNTTPTAIYHFNNKNNIINKEICCFVESQSMRCFDFCRDVCLSVTRTGGMAHQFMLIFIFNIFKRIFDLTFSFQLYFKRDYQDF